MKLTLETNVHFQVLSYKNGTRTPVMKTTIGELRNFVQERLDNGFNTEPMDNEEPYDYFKDYVLILADDSEGEVLFSDFPAFRIEHFIDATNFIVKQQEQEQ
ncbi:MAG: hypothetical protein QXT77_09970 [Candidatus Methanomethylicaceae archaeon]